MDKTKEIAVLNEFSSPCVSEKGKILALNPVICFSLVPISVLGLNWMYVTEPSLDCME